jgi:hypothetical protein
MDALRDYQVIRDGNEFGTSFSNGYLFTSEYDRARQQFDRLIEEYTAIPFSEIFSGEEITNEGGACFRLRDSCDLPSLDIDNDRFRRDVLADLTLIRGIGPATQRLLKKRGYDTLEDLVRHPKFREPARQVFDRLSQGNSTEIMDLVGSRHTKSHPFVLGTAGLHEPEDYVFLDIETMGLFSRPIILIGVGTIERGKLMVYQYFVRDISEEQAALVSAMEHLSGDHPALVTFNGKSFDMPYIQDRLAYYGIRSHNRLPHYDVLHFSRARWKNQYPSLRLSVLEKEILGISREDDVPGQLVPEFYDSYLRTGNCGPLVPVIEHNKQDVISLALLFAHLIGETYGSQ